MLIKFMSFGTCSWLMSVYARDILSRLPQLLATCTAIFGSVLKIDSTKKVCRKLQGIAAGSAFWCTNVGNERGEVLISVLTESEGLESLRPMAQELFTGLPSNFVVMFTFHYFNQVPEGQAGSSTDVVHRQRLLFCHRAIKCAQLFAEWNHLQVSRYCDPFIMIMQLAGVTGCLALHAKACMWLQHRVSFPLWTFYVSPL